MSDLSTKNEPSRKGSGIAKRSAARLNAVQAVYQAVVNDDFPEEIVREYLNHRIGKPVDGESMVFADEKLFSSIVSGVRLRFSDLESIVQNARNDDANDVIRALPEPLLYSIILCGCFELLAHGDIDGPVIVNDYVNITKAFYDNGEEKLVNALLDKIFKVVRA